MNIIDSNISLGIKYNIINVSHLSQKITNLLHIEDYKNISIFYEPKPLGVFGGIYSIISGSNCNFDLFIHNSDIYFDGKLQGIFHRDNDLVLGMINNGKKDFHVNEQNEIAFHESKQFLGYSGIMLIRRNVLKFFKDRYIPNTYLNFISDFIDILKTTDFTIGAEILKGNWFDIGTLEGLQKAQGIGNN